MEDGVWRTIGGRRVFIKDGQSLSEAMKESGKFKQKEKDKVEVTTIKKEKEFLGRENRMHYSALKREIEYEKYVIEEYEKENKELENKLKEEGLSNRKTNKMKHDIRVNNNRIKEHEKSLKSYEPLTEHYDNIFKRYDVNKYSGKEDIMNSFEQTRYKEALKNAKKEISIPKNLNKEKMTLYTYNHSEQLDLDRPIFVTPGKEDWNLRFGVYEHKIEIEKASAYIVETKTSQKNEYDTQELMIVLKNK